MALEHDRDSPPGYYFCESTQLYYRVWEIYRIGRPGRKTLIFIKRHDPNTRLHIWQQVPTAYLLVKILVTICAGGEASRRKQGQGSPGDKSGIWV